MPNACEQRAEVCAHIITVYDVASDVYRCQECGAFMSARDFNRLCRDQPMPIYERLARGYGYR